MNSLGNFPSKYGLIIKVSPRVFLTLSKFSNYCKSFFYSVLSGTFKIFLSCRLHTTLVNHAIAPPTSFPLIYNERKVKDNMFNGGVYAKVHSIINYISFLIRRIFYAPKEVEVYIE